MKVIYHNNALCLKGVKTCDQLFIMKNEYKFNEIYTVYSSYYLLSQYKKKGALDKIF